MPAYHSQEFQQYRHALHCTLNERLGDDVVDRVMRRFQAAFPPDVTGNEAAWEMVWVAIVKEELANKEVK